MLEAATDQPVHPFRESAAAMLWIRDHAPDLVITDQTMTGPSGIELIRWIRTLPARKRTPVMLLTGDAEPSLARAAMEDGVDRVVQKPLEIGELLSEVDFLMGRDQPRRASDSTT